MKSKFIIEITFSKTGLMRYISHLDLLRVFLRCTNRAKLNLQTSCGFNPHPKISVRPAIKLGLESNELSCQFALNEKILAQEFIARLAKQLPQGIRISSGKLLESNKVLNA
jgi:radical SAM-linked protein